MQSAVESRAVRRGRDLFRVGRPFLVGGAHILALFPRWVARTLLALNRHVPGYPGLAIRYVCIRRLAATCGDNVAVYAGVYLYDLDKCHLGSNVKIGEMCFVGAAGGVVIEDDVSIAHATTLLTEEHDYVSPGPLRDSPILHQQVHIEAGSWIGAGVRITAGVTIGRGSAVGAGSVVTRDIPPMSIAVGVPARVLKGRPVR